MQKPRAIPDLRFVFHPEQDREYVHFDGHEQAPFEASAPVVTARQCVVARGSGPPLVLGRGDRGEPFRGSGPAGTVRHRGGHASVRRLCRSVRDRRLQRHASTASAMSSPMSRCRWRPGRAAPCTWGSSRRSIASGRASWRLSSRSPRRAPCGLVVTVSVARSRPSRRIASAIPPARARSVRRRVRDRLFAAGFVLGSPTRMLRYVNDADLRGATSRRPPRFHTRSASGLRRITPDGRETARGIARLWPVFRCRRVQRRRPSRRSIAPTQRQHARRRTRFLSR